MPLGDATVDRYSHRDGSDDATQPGNLFRLVSASQKEQPFASIAEVMGMDPSFLELREVVSA